MWENLTSEAMWHKNYDGDNSTSNYNDNNNDNNNDNTGNKHKNINDKKIHFCNS